MNNFEKSQASKIASFYSNKPEDHLEKGGAGSRGGKVIGHTKSGKPIYEKHQKIVDYAKSKGYEIDHYTTSKTKGVDFNITHNDKEDTSGLMLADTSKHRSKHIANELQEKLGDKHDVKVTGGLRMTSSLINIKDKSK